MKLSSISLKLASISIKLTSICPVGSLSSRMLFCMNYERIWFVSLVRQPKQIFLTTQKHFSVVLFRALYLFIFRICTFLLGLSLLCAKESFWHARDVEMPGQQTLNDFSHIFQNNDFFCLLLYEIEDFVYF